MILGFGISMSVQTFIGDKYEFDNKYWQLVAMNWEGINDTWEEEI